MTTHSASIESGLGGSSGISYSPESWKIDPEILSESARSLLIEENKAPIIVSRDTSLRPKILDACGMACTFCHNEGTPVVAEVLGRGNPNHRALGRVSIYSDTNGVNFLPGRMRPDESLASALTALNEAVGAEEIHLTGGEPTLHPELADIISLGRDLGLKVKMTSNGENPRAFEKCAQAGLSRVIFSVFGTTAEELSQVQHPRYQNPKLAQRKIDSLHRSISAAGENGIQATANVVVPGPGHEERIASIIGRFDNLSLRLLNSLDEGDRSFAAIYEILAQLGATPTNVKLTAGSSSSRTTYELPNGKDISFKQIRPARFDHVCTDCDVDNRNECQEGFYGLRLYVNQDNEYLVGFCIQRMDLVMTLEEFLNSELPEQIMTFRATEEKQMNDFVARIAA